MVTEETTNATLRLKVDKENGQRGTGPDVVPKFDIIGDNHNDNSLEGQDAIDVPEYTQCDMNNFVIGSSVFTGIGGAIDITLSIAIVASGKSNPGVKLMYAVTVARFILEDVPQLIITYKFLQTGQGDIANAWSMFFSLISLAQAARAIIYDKR